MATPDITISDLGEDFPVSDEDMNTMFKDLAADPEASEKKDPPAATSTPTGDDPGVDPDDDDDDDQRAVKSQEELDAATPEAAAAARERKKTDRLNQRQRMKARIENLERQLSNTLSANQEAHMRLAQLENTNVGTQYASIQKAEAEAVQAVQGLKDIIADASVKGDGVRVAEATHALVQVQREQERLGQVRQQFEQQARQPAHRQQQVDPETMAHVNAFVAKHSWYKGPKATDRDSRVMAMLDNELTREGWNPRSPTYWTELETRAKVYLGHRFSKDEGASTNEQANGLAHNADTPRRPKQPVAGGGSNNTGGSGKGTEEFRISHERVKAMKQAGIWDDPARREKMIQRYKAQDAEAARQS